MYQRMAPYPDKPFYSSAWGTGIWSMSSCLFPLLPLFLFFPQWLRGAPLSRTLLMGLCPMFLPSAASRPRPGLPPAFA